MPLRASARVRDAIVVVALVVVGALSCYLRVPLAHTDIVWGEDGEIFLLEFLRYGLAGSVFEGYAGYQHLVPRLVAGLVIPIVPLEAYPAAVFAVCAVLTGLVGAAVYTLARDVVPWAPARVALGLVTFVLPLATQEVIGNLADLHSYAMWLAPWLLFARPRTRWSAAGWAVVAFLVVMTEVQAIVFLPLLLLVVRRRFPTVLPVAAAFVAGAVWQVVTIVTVERVGEPQWFGIPSLLQGYLVNTVMPLVIADPDAVRRHLESSGLLIPVVVCVPLVAAFVVAVIRGDLRQRVLAVTLVLASGAVYAGGAVISGLPQFDYADAALPLWERAVNIRWGVSAGMLLVAVVPLAAAVLRGAGRARALRSVVAWAAVIGLVVVLAAASTRAVSTRGWVAAQWTYSVDRAQDECRDLPGDAEVMIPIAPLREIAMTCDEIAATAR